MTDINNHYEEPDAPWFTLDWLEQHPEFPLSPAIADPEAVAL